VKPCVIIQPTFTGHTKCWTCKVFFLFLPAEILIIYDPALSLQSLTDYHSSYIFHLINVDGMVYLQSPRYSTMYTHHVSVQPT